MSLGQDEQILKDIVDKVVSSISAGEDFSLEEGYTKKIEVAGNEGLVVQYVSSAEDVVAVDENGTVTAKSAGKATVTAKIGDISDEVEITVTPRAAAGANEIEALDSPLSAGNIVSGNADSWEIGFSEDGIGGEQKVVKIAATSAGELTSFYVKPRIDLSAFGADSYISFYMYIDADTLTSGETFKQIQVGYSGGNAFAVPAEEWVRVTQPLSDFTESEEFPGYYGLLKLHNGGEFGAADNKMEFYLRDIAICERTDVNTEAGEIAALTDGSLNDIAMFRGTDNEKTAASVKYISDEVTGDSGAVYIESLVLEGYPAIYVRPRTGSDWEGAKGVAFDIYVDAATINGNAVRWIENAEGSRYLPVKAGVWTTLSVPIEKFIAHASDDETSGTSGFYTLGFFGNDGIGDRPSNANFAFYIRNVRAVSGKTVSENALTAFDELSVYDDIYFADNNCFAASYDQEGIAGKQGVLRFDQIEDVGAPTFFVKTDADISSYKYVSFEIYFVGSSLSDGHTGKIILAGDTAKDPWINPYTGNSDRTPVPADQWVQLTFEVKYFIADGDTGYYLFTFMNGGGDWPKDTEATFYISDVQGLTEYPQ